MLRRILDPLRRIDWERSVARAGTFASDHQTALRRVMFAVGFAFIVLLIHREVYSFIGKRARYTVPEIRAAVAPSWADSQGIEIVRVDTKDVSIFDPELVDRIGRAFEACPWVRRVISVERAFPDRVKVRLEYRKPRVAVRGGAGYILVDEDGIRLPGVYVRPPAVVSGPVIAGLSVRPPAPGTVWKNEALEEGMQLADFIEQEPMLERLAVRTIDVSNFRGRQDGRTSEVSLVCANGCTLMWGRTPATSRFGDPSPDEKLDNLREVLVSYPGLRGLRCVKLYFRGISAIEPQQAHVQGPR